MAGTLAQTIQGEASDPAGQFAVAATIANRAKAGTFPGGSDPTAIVNAPQQYVGYAATPSANAQALADAIQNGTLDQFGTTGNAVNFQSGPTAAANGLTAGTNIGGNWFSDQFGAPTPNFVAPVLGGAGGTLASDGGTLLTTVAGPVAGAANPAQGQQVQVGIQPSAVQDIQGWIAGIAKGLWTSTWDTVSSTFLNIQNWFIRAFVIVVGIVILAIGLLKITGTDKVVVQAVKTAAMAAA